MDERPLQRACHILLRALSEQTCDPLGDVESDQDESEDREEDEGRQPGQKHHASVRIAPWTGRLQTRPGARYERSMADAPVTLEGWYTLHEMYAVDWARWSALAAAERDAIVTEAASLLEAQQRPADGHSAVWSLLTQKGDLCFMHWP